MLFLASPGQIALAFRQCSPAHCSVATNDLPRCTSHLAPLPTFPHQPRQYQPFEKAASEPHQNHTGTCYDNTKNTQAPHKAIAASPAGRKTAPHLFEFHHTGSRRSFSNNQINVSACAMSPCTTAQMTSRALRECWTTLLQAVIR